MQSLKERLAHAMNLRGVSATSLVEATGISRSAVYFMLDGTTKAENIRALTIDKAARALSVNREWLLYGQGSPDEAREANVTLPRLVEAVQLVRIDESLGGTHSTERHAVLLLELCDRLAAGKHPQELAAWLAHQRA